MKVTPPEIIFKILGANQCQHHREVDLEVITIIDLLVGEEGDWLTMEDGDLWLKQHTRGPTMTHCWMTIKLQSHAMNYVKNGTTLMAHAPSIQALITGGENVLFFKSIKSFNKDCLPLTLPMMSSIQLDDERPPSQASALAPSTGTLQL